MASLVPVLLLAWLSGSEAVAVRGRRPREPTTTIVGSLPLQPLAALEVEALQNCNDSKSLDAWTGGRKTDAIAQSIAAWRAHRPSSPVLLDTGGGAGCLMAAPAAADADATLAQLFSLAEVPEEAICADNKDRSLAEIPDTAREAFPVAGRLAEEYSSTREYFAVWPKENICTEEHKCPIVVFFHGCGRYYHFEQMAKYDDACSESLRSVMLFPSTEKWMESWTGYGTGMLDEFVLPLLEQFKREHGAIVDDSRVVAVGESLGSGIALQAGLLHPDLFSAVVAMGITDGSTCEDVQVFHPEKLAVEAAASTANTSNWKLQLVVATFAENEANVQDRVSGVLGLLEDSGASDRVAVHFRMFADTGHAQCLDFVQNRWSGFHKAIWEGISL